MAKFIVSEGIARLIARKMLEESYQDKIDLVKDYLDKNFMQKYDEDVEIFIKLKNGLPTDKLMWKQDVLDELDRKYSGIITDKKERDGFLNQVVDDWYYKRISKFGSLSSYNF